MNPRFKIVTNRYYFCEIILGEAGGFLRLSNCSRTRVMTIATTGTVWSYAPAELKFTTVVSVSCVLTNATREAESSLISLNI